MYGAYLGDFYVFHRMGRENVLRIRRCSEVIRVVVLAICVILQAINR